MFMLMTGTYVRLVDMERKVRKPPPIRESMRVLVQQYPDKIHMRTELSSGHTLLGISMIGQSSAFYESKLVPIAKEMMQLPTFETGSVLAGTINPPVDKYDFDWDAYSDLDSVGFEAGAIVMPDTIYNIAIVGAFACWPDQDSFSPAHFSLQIRSAGAFCQALVNQDSADISPFVIVIFNGRDMGMTDVKSGESWSGENPVGEKK